MRARSAVVSVMAAMVLLVGTAFVEAQEVGVKAGVVVSNVNIRKPDLLPLELQWCCSPWDGARFGATGGIYMTLPFTDLVTGRAELLFTRRGFRISEHGKQPGADLRLTYFEIPMLVQVGHRPVQLFAGASVALGVASSAIATRGGVSRPSEFAAEDNVSSFDVGLVVGVGVGRGRYFAEGRYTHGFVNVLRESPGGSSVRNKAFLIMVGVRLSKARPPKAEVDTRATRSLR